jgi:hypothetical protein
VLHNVHASSDPHPFAFVPPPSVYLPGQTFSCCVVLATQVPCHLVILYTLSDYAVAAFDFWCCKAQALVSHGPGCLSGGALPHLGGRPHSSLPKKCWDNPPVLRNQLSAHVVLADLNFRMAVFGIQCTSAGVLSDDCYHISRQFQS